MPHGKPPHSGVFSGRGRLVAMPVSTELTVNGLCGPVSPSRASASTAGIRVVMGQSSPSAGTFPDTPGMSLAKKSANPPFRPKRAVTVPVRDPSASRSLGYESNGEGRLENSLGVVEREVRFRLTEDGFHRPEWQLTLEGHERSGLFCSSTRPPGRLGGDDAFPLPSPEDIDKERESGSPPGVNATECDGDVLHSSLRQDSPTSHKSGGSPPTTGARSSGGSGPRGLSSSKPSQLRCRRRSASA